MSAKRPVYFISDFTGITAEALGKSLLAQFDHMQFERHTLPFIDSLQRAEEALAHIQHSAQSSGLRPIVFSTLTQAELRTHFATAPLLFIDLFASFLASLEAELGCPAAGAIGKARDVNQDYLHRIEAVNFALNHDDGLGQHWEQADLILLGVSRSGKTPTSLYLALQHGLRIANYPLTSEDFEHVNLPALLQPHQTKLIGLTIMPERLSQIREQRQPGSRYASLSACSTELRQAEALYRKYDIPRFDTSSKSIEEIAAGILHQYRPTSSRGL